MMYKKSAKLSSLIKECRSEMKNDLYFLHSALQEVQMANRDLSIIATKSFSSSCKKKYIGGALLSSTISDQQLTTSSYFYTSGSQFGNKKRKFVANDSEIRARKICKNKRKRSSEKKSFTYKHYDLYLLTKNSIENCRNFCDKSSLLEKKNTENLSLEKSCIKNMEETSVENQTIFEPKFSSSPIRREQKTSTPTKKQSCVMDKPKICLINASRLKFFNTTNFQTSANTTGHSQPNVHSFEGYQNTSTPKVIRRNNVSTGTTYTYKVCGDSKNRIIESFCEKDLPAPSMISSSNVSTVIKCCIQPLKKFILCKNAKKSNKNKEF